MPKRTKAPTKTIVKEQEAKPAVLPEELKHPLVFMQQHSAYDTGAYYHANENNLLAAIEDNLYNEDGEVLVYKLVPYAIVEPVPASFRIKE